jgi:hypothetical protein
MESDGQHNPHEQELDNRLAEFADRVMVGATEQHPTVKPMDPRAEKMLQESDEAEIEALEETILSFYSAVKAARPDPAAVARIEAGVKTEWQGPAQTGWKSWFSTFQTGFKLQAVVAVAIITIVLLTVSLIRPDGGTLVGTASGYPAWAFFVLVIAGIVIFILFKKDRP